MAAIIDRCLRRDPFARFASADDLRSALEQLTPMGRELAIPEGNPYRGLQAFEPQPPPLSSGASAGTRAVAAPPRAAAPVVAPGDSGTGKSSLCRAGVLPVVEEGGLEPGRSWASAAMTPGRYPLQTLTATLAGLFDMTEETVAALIAGESEALIRALRKQLGDVRGRLLFVDQLEELVTLGEAKEVAVVGLVLARLASGIPGLRVLTTVRGDFLTRVAQIPTLGDEIGRAIYLLRQLSPEGAREAIVGPAQTKGVSFETEALVDQLVQAGSGGSLPLLQFALAELWEIRDKASACISAADLTKIGGVTGALARHGDGALAQLLPAQRRAGRRVLMRLVTLDDTRASLTEDELVAGEAAARAALAALVQARLVVVRGVGDRVVYEIAHEALLAGWTTLRTWLDEERDSRAVRHRLELAVADWERLGRSSDGLWTTAQLVAARLLEPETLRPRELEFLAASRVAVARGRVLRRAALVALPVLALLVYLGSWLQAEHALRTTVNTYVRAAHFALAQAQVADRSAARLQSDAFAHFDRGDLERGEALWAAALVLQPSADQHYTRAAQALETALSYDPGSAPLRDRLADALYARALLAEPRRQPAQAQELLARLKLYDQDQARRSQWDAPATMTVRSDPPGALVSLEAYVEDAHRRRVARPLRGLTAGETLELAPGSYRLTFALSGHVPVHYPVLLERAEALELEVALPRAEEVPPGFVFVPPGRFLYASADHEDVRKQFFTAQPMHEVTTGPYLIAAHETTYSDYISFLESLAPAEQAEHLPRSGGNGQRGNALELRDGRWQFTLHSGSGPHRYVVSDGELLRYEQRDRRAQVDWQKFPVTGISIADASAYLRWLDRTGRVPGARFCTEHEWERAARGADGRNYPHGDELAPDDANFDETYRKELVAMGPDPVGSYTQSQSPFGVLDATGNAFEIAVSPFDPNAKLVRGGGYFFDRSTVRLINRSLVDPSLRDSSFGLRVCATYKPAR